MRPGVSNASWGSARKRVPSCRPGRRVQDGRCGSLNDRNIPGRPLDESAGPVSCDGMAIDARAASPHDIAAVAVGVAPTILLW